MTGKSNKKMRILISNDDSLYAPGIKVLEKLARKISDDVWVIAPATEQSATAHSLTIHRPLRPKNWMKRNGRLMAPLQTVY